MQIEGCDLPRMYPVRQHLKSHALPDVGSAVLEELRRVEVGAELPRGSSVAIGVGSRGVARLPELVRSTVAYFEAVGLKPFLVPAMGSHGGGTGEGQRAVLQRYGVTEESAGCPIVSSIETVDLGTTPDGIETYMDRAAFESGGVFLINRVKWHTSFEAPIESGVVKMAAIGLGKVRGATNYHCAAVRRGLGDVVRSVGRHVLGTGRVIGGLCVVEDAHHEVGRVAVERAPRLEELEIGLLELARSWMARLPFDTDILIVDETGKQFSGTGVDSKIVNRHPYGGTNPWPWAPRITRIYLRDLSPKSYGNAVGIGMADMISERLYGKIDWPTTLVNAQAASNLSAIRAPYRAANDREALGLLATMVGRQCPADVRSIWIRNTLELGEMAVSENLLGGGEVEQTGPPFDLAFDANGNLEERP